MENIVNLRLQRHFLGSLLSGIGSVVGGVVNANSQRRQNDRNIQAQMEENQRNREFTEEMYQKYESPVAQRQQMLEAGLNPMGAVAPQSVGSASTSALPPGQAPEFGSAIQQGIESFWSAGTALREQRLKDQEIEKAKLENWRQAFENGNAQALLDTQLAEIRSRTALNRQEKRLKKQEEKRLILEYTKAKEAYEAGINEHVDTHNESVARTNNTNLLSDFQSIQNDIASSTAEYQKKSKETEYESAKRALDLFNDTYDHQKSLAQFNAKAQEFLAKAQERDYQVSDYVSAFDNLFGFDPRLLPPALQGFIIAELWQATSEDGNISEKNYITLYNHILNGLNAYLKRQTYIGSSESFSSGFNLFGLGADSSYSYSSH